MKPVRKDPGFRLWRRDQRGLSKVGAFVDRMIELAEANGDEGQRDFVTSGLTDLKLRVSRELRENMKAEFHARREQVALDDMELAGTNDPELLHRLKLIVDGKLARVAAGTAPVPRSSNGNHALVITQETVSSVLEVAEPDLETPRPDLEPHSDEPGTN